MLGIGIDLGGTNIKGALVDDKKGIIKKISIPTEAEKGRDHTLDRIARAIEMAAGYASDNKPVGVGIGSPGVISLDQTTVSNPPNLPGWQTVNLASEIKKRTGYVCRVENDANLAAVGSMNFGVGTDLDSFIMLTLGTGVGGGIIFKRELFRGTTGGAAELGHVIIDYHGPISNSPARGGIEAYIGQRFLSRYAADIIRQYPENPLYEKFVSDWESLEPLHLFNAANEDNKIAQDILISAGEKLGYAIVNYIHVLDIRKIVLSGGVAQAGHWIMDSAKETALSRLMLPFHDGFEVIYEPLGNDAALLGAASLTFDFKTKIL